MAITRRTGSAPGAPEPNTKPTVLLAEDSIVQRTTIADAPVGVFLSGGVRLGENACASLRQGHD